MTAAAAVAAGFSKRLLAKWILASLDADPTTI
jgi:hypothetical protein